MPLLTYRLRSHPLISLLILSVASVTNAQATTPGKVFSFRDLQHLQAVSDVQLSPDGRTVVYSVHSIDIQYDGYTQMVWALPLSGARVAIPLPHVAQPSWSPDGKTLAVVGDNAGKHTIQLLRGDTFAAVQTVALPSSPESLVWSPDGSSLAFTLMTRETNAPSFLQQSVDHAMAELEKPADAHWAGPVQITQAAHYREDGAGWLPQESGHRHLFVLRTTDGTLHQVGTEPFNDSAPAWSADSKTLLFTSDRRPGWEHLFTVTAIYQTDMAGHSTRLTQGSDYLYAPKASPDGRWIAYMRTPDRQANYTTSKLFIVRPDGTQAHQLAVDLDRDLSPLSWAADSRGLYAKFSDHGIAHVGLFSVDGTHKVMASGLGGAFSVSRDGTIAYSGARVDGPNELMLQTPGKLPETLTSLNPSLQQRQLGKLVHLSAELRSDGVSIEGWALLPPGSTEHTKLPTILVLHGGPFGDDGPIWDSERELFAAAGYAVVYGNYRGSTSYGAAFSEPANDGFPGVAYSSAISLVDEGIRQGFVDPDRLFVTGASAGAELTVWITGKTHRFRAAAAEKPLIEEMSEALSSDQYLAAFLVYGGAPWMHEKKLWENSPLSLAESVTTPTLFIVGEDDFRTPVEQSLQMYDALQLRGVPTALLRAPGASHSSLRARPSQNTAVVAATLAWFHKYDTPQTAPQQALDQQAASGHSRNDIRLAP